VTTSLTVVLVLVGGFLLGGVWSLYKQQAPKVAIGIVALLCLLAFAGAALRVLPV